MKFLLVLALSAAAQDFSACVRRTEDSLLEPESLTGLLLCQASAKRAAGGSPSGLAAFQEAELQDYLKRHPDQAKRLEESREQARKKLEGLEKSRSAVKANAARLEPGQGEGLAELQEKLVQESGGGAFGITPQAAKDIASHLKQVQGGPSVEMDDLLKSLQKDGADLKPETMLKLKRAARAASGEGLDLGLEGDMEKWLLDPATDPEAKSQGLPLN